MKRPYFIVIGNEKGGSGKSTTAMHLAITLQTLGRKVACIDLDGRQATLTRYLENRRNFSETNRLPLQTPECRTIRRSESRNRDDAEKEEAVALEKAIGELSTNNDVIIIDCPGSDTYLAREAHAHADTLITPMNDSFIDLDLLASVDGDTFEIKSPSFYSEMVWEARKQKASRFGGSLDWIVMRNRLSSLNAKNKMRINKVLSKLATRIGFRLAKGFGDRVIYRELFLKGLTLVDMKEIREGTGISMSHLAARQELRDLVNILRLPEEVLEKSA